MRRRRSLGTLLLAGGALTVAAATARGRGRSADHRAFWWTNSRMEHPVLDRFFTAVTELGSLYASAGGAAAMALAGRRREAANAFGAAGVMWLVGQALKDLYARPRPFQGASPFRLLIARPRGTSWPSSHPAVFLAFAMVAARELDAPPAARAVVTGLAVAVAGSRVYLGVHYPSDVVGGLMLGAAVAGLWPSASAPAFR